MHLFGYHISGFIFVLFIITSLRFIASMSDFIVWDDFFEVEPCFAKDSNIRFIIISMWDLEASRFWLT